MRTISKITYLVVGSICSLWIGLHHSRAEQKLAGPHDEKNQLSPPSECGHKCALGYVCLFSEHNFGGRMVSFGFNDSQLDDYGFNDSAQSWINCMNQDARLFQNNDYDGDHLCLHALTKSTNMDRWDDKASSIKVNQNRDCGN